MIGATHFTRVGAMTPVRFTAGRGAGPWSIEPPRTVWADLSAYDETLRQDFIRPLAEAASVFGQAPPALQRSVLDRLHWYFTVDRRAVAPTLVVDDALADVFHQRVSEVMRFVSPESLEDISPQASAEVRHALLSYKSLTTHSAVSIDAVDQEQGLVRLTYWVHGEPPAERFFVDDREVKPLCSKYRGCKYFRRNLVRQRIVWLPATEDSTSLHVQLDGASELIGVGPQPFSLRGGAPAAQEPVRTWNTLLHDARVEYPARKGPPVGSAPGQSPVEGPAGQVDGKSARRPDSLPRRLGLH